MRRITGPLRQVTPVECLNKMQGLTIDTICIGDHTLRKVKVDSIVTDSQLREIRGDARLYLFYVLFTPNLLGMKDMGSGEKYLVPASFILGSMLRYAVIGTLVFSIGGAIIGGVLGTAAVTMLGIESLTHTPTAGIGFACGAALAWWYVLRLPLDYLRARMD